MTSDPMARRMTLAPALSVVFALLVFAGIALLTTSVPAGLVVLVLAVGVLGLRMWAAWQKGRWIRRLTRG
jgi:hypothetical protein